MNSYGDFGGIDLDSLLVGSMVFLAVIGIIFIAIAIFYLVAFIKVYKKAGYRGWEAIIPFYSSWILVKIANLHWMYFIMLISVSIASFFGFNSSIEVLASIAVLLANFNCNFNIAKKFGKTSGFAIGMTLLPVIFYPILAFSKNCIYDNQIEVSLHGIFKSVDNTSNTNNNQNSQSTNNTIYQNLDNSDRVNDVNSDKSTEVNVNQENNVNNYQNNNDKIFCSSCGYENKLDNTYCTNCGKPIIR